MTLDALYTQLSTAPIFSGNTFTLPAGAIDNNGPVYNLISTWMGSNMTVSAMSQPPQKNGNTITLSGEMTLPGLKNQQVSTIVFAVIDANGNPAADGTPALYIDVALPASWNYI
jgi:hypothetical protein